MNQPKGSNRELLETINKKLDAVNEDTKKINDISKNHTDVLHRLESIESEVKGMNNKVINHASSITWIISVGSGIATFIGAGFVLMYNLITKQQP